MICRIALRLFLLAVLLLELPACALVQKVVPKRKRPPRATAVPGPQFIGTVTLVNEQSRFVLIDNGDRPAPEAGAVLQTFSGAQETADLVVTEVKKRPFIIADVRGGLPRKGDRVLMPYMEKRSETPAAVAQPAAPAAQEEAAPTPAKKRRWWTLGLF